MLKKPRQLLALLLAGLFTAILLAACGDNTATNAPAQAITTAAVAATSAAATTAPKPTAAVTTTAAAPGTTAAAAATTALAASTTAAATAAGASTTAGLSGTTTASGAAPGATVACDKPVAAASNGKTYKIGISVQNSIPDLLAAIDGFKKGLAQCGFVEGKNVKYDLGNALGDIPQLTTIGKKFNDDKDDLIMAVGTAALVAMYNTNKDTNTPIIFNSVTDPYVALKGVINSPTDHGNLTGIQALAPVEDALKIMLQVVPNAKNIGLIFNPAETNSKIAHDTAVEVAGRLGLKIVDASIANSGEVLQAAQALADKVDAFFTTTDVTVVNALESLIKVGTDSKKPVFGNNFDASARGEVAAVGLDYADNGVASAAKAAQVLDGKKIQDIPIDKQKKGALGVNLKGAEQMGVKVPEALQKQADQVFTDIRKS